MIPKPLISAVGLHFSARRFEDNKTTERTWNYVEICCLFCRSKHYRIVLFTLFMSAVRVGKRQHISVIMTFLLMYLLAYLHTYFLIYLLAYLLNYLLTGLITLLLACLLTYLLPYLLTCLITYLLTFTYSLHGADSFLRS